MASASSSPCSASTSYAPYDVFINHRGEDVKKTFASHLYRALKSRGLQVFLDRPEMKAGHDFYYQIEAAIKVASVHVAIFSPTYAKSDWCMKELVLMLKSAGIIIPVFYNVQPSVLRWTDEGAYAEALQHHEKMQRYDLTTIGDWRKALSRAANISGFELKDCSGDEVDLVDKIVKRVFELVPKPPIYVARYPVGLDEKLKDFERTVLSQPENEGQLVKVVGIVGTGGIGKSTLAKALINLKRSDYKTSSLLVDVRENATKKSLNYLQKKLIKDLTGIDISIDNWQEGVGILQKNLKSCQAIIILDDADDRNQLDAFLPIKHVLDSKSLIVVTSRDKQVLINAEIANSSIYPLKGLDRSQSLELFCWHAFFQLDPQSEFVDLVDGFLEACDGLPLSLEILGALLCQQDRSYWVDLLNGLQNLPRGIQERLRISYDSLEPEEQQIFLDIACFAIGESKHKWIKIWHLSDWKGSAGLRNLENKCLVEVDSENEIITMHDHLRDLGRCIAKEKSIPRRLWSAKIEDVYDLLEQPTSSVIEVRGIKMAPRYTRSGNWEKGRLGDEKFRISKLQLLEADGDIVEGILEVLPPNLNLMWLNWMSCPCSSLPSSIPMRHLRGLKVRGQKLERLWQNESQAPVQLRELNIEAPLLEFPNSIGKLQHLEKIELTGLFPGAEFGRPTLATLPEEFCSLQSLKYLVLRSCSELQVLPSYFGNLTNLQYINLNDCSKLQTLPDSFCKLTNLRQINLSNCSQLKMLPNFLEKLSNLQEIVLNGCESLQVLPDDLGTLRNLQVINLARCIQLKMLPMFSENLTNLREIDLRGCKSLEVLPDAFGRTLRNLQVIDLEWCKQLKMLPIFSEKLTNIQEINLSYCESLEVISDTFGTLTNLQKICLRSCGSLKRLPSSIENLTNLREIDLLACKSLEVLPDALGTLRNLEVINLAGCIQLKMLPMFSEDLTNLREIDLRCCKSLEVLPDAFGRTIRNLRVINLESCEQLKMLPFFSEKLTNLQEIDLSYCESLEVLSDTFGTLTNLQKISLWRCRSLKKLPSSIENLTNLREIDLGHCESLEVLPDDLGTLTNLYKINLKRCKSLKMLPNSIGGLTNLRMINLKGCVSLETLPHNFGNLTNLQYIDASDNINLQMPSNILGNLLRLQHLHLGGCDQLTISNETLGNITTFECLNLSFCLQVEVLPLQVLHQSSLRKLDLLGTNIKVFPSEPMTCLSNLQDFILGSPLLQVLPPWLGHLKGLENLMLHGCPELKCLPNSVEQLAQLKHLHISECGIAYLPPDVMKMNNLITLEVFGCPLRELPFKKVRGGGEPSLSSTESSPRRELDSSNQPCMIQLMEIHLNLTEISEISFPEGVCPNLKRLTIRWCNRLVEVGALPTTLNYLNLKGCGALRKIEGLCGLANLQVLDIRGCCPLQVEEVPGHGSVISLDVLRPILRSLVVLKAPFETYDKDPENDSDSEADVELRVWDLNYSWKCRHFKDDC